MNATKEGTVNYVLAGISPNRPMLTVVIDDNHKPYLLRMIDHDIEPTQGARVEMALTDDGWKITRLCKT